MNRRFFSVIDIERESVDRRVAHDLASEYGHHQLVWSLLRESPDDKRDFLYRVDVVRGAPRIWLVSSHPPRDRAGLVVRTREYAPVIRAGDRLRFTLRASPVVARLPPEQEREGKAPLGTPTGAGAVRSQRYDAILVEKQRRRASGEPALDAAELVQTVGTRWLLDRAARLGMEIAAPSLRADGYRSHELSARGQRGGRTRRAIRFSTIDFTGTLRVIDPDLFCAGLGGGVGPQKAFGCGLLLVRRA